MDKFYQPDDEPRKVRFRDHVREVRADLARGWGEAKDGVAREWQLLSITQPWVVQNWKALLAAVIALILVVPASFAAWFWFTAPNSPKNLHSRILLEQPGQKLHPAVSPDGKRIAFTWDGGKAGGNYDVYIMSTAPEDKGKAPERITSHEANDIRPAWSPDGNRIAFIRNTPEEILLMITTVDKHEEMRLRALEGKGWYAFAVDPLMANVSPGPAWSPDGTALIVTDSRNTEDGVSLWKVDLVTAEREKLTHPGESAVDLYPQRAPSGDELAFIRRINENTAEAFAVSATTGAERQISSGSFDLRGAALMSNRRDILLSSDSGGRRRLLFYSPKAPDAEVIDVPGDYNFEPAWTGKLLAWTAVRSSWSLAELPLEGGEPGAGERTLRSLAAPRGRNHSPAFSPDGRNLIWISDAKGSWEVWKADLSVGSQQRLTNIGSTWGGRAISTPSWSPDGRKIVLQALPNGRPAIAVMDPAGASVRVGSEARQSELHPCWSNDGRWIYFGSDRDRGLRIWRRQPDGGQAVRITSREGRQACESFDGSMLLYVPGPLVPGVWQMPSSGGDETVLPGTEQYFVRGHWAVAPHGVYFIGYPDDPKALMYYSFVTQTVERVMTLPKPLPPDVPAMAVDRAGTRLVIVQQDEYSSEVMIATR